MVSFLVAFSVSSCILTSSLISPGPSLCLFYLSLFGVSGIGMGICRMASAAIV
jgi:hypothetical protein